MAVLAIRVELGLTQTSGAFIVGVSLLGGTDVLTSGYDWTDVAADIEEGSLSWSRGATRGQGPWFRYESGHCSFTLDNNSGGDRYSPLNTSGPYTVAGVSMLRPGVPVRVIIETNSTDHVVFSGWVDTWQPANTGDRWSTVSVTASDGVERLTAANLPAVANPVGAGDTAGQRINRILDNIGWPISARNIDVSGTITMQATSMAQSAWTDCLLTADSAGGFLYLSATGKVTYLERRTVPPSPSYTFAAGSGIATDIAEDLVLSYDRQQVFNNVGLSRAGGTAQWLTNEVSAADAQNGLRSYSRSDLVCETDAQVQEIAQFVLFYYGTLKYRVESFSLPLMSLSSSSSVVDSWTLAASLEMVTRVRIGVPQPNMATIDQQGLIRGLSWAIGANGSATVTVSLQQTPTTVSPFIVGVSLLGGTDVLSPF